MHRFDRTERGLSLDRAGEWLPEPLVLTAAAHVIDARNPLVGTRYRFRSKWEA